MGPEFWWSTRIFWKSTFQNFKIPVQDILHMEYNISWKFYHFSSTTQEDIMRSVLKIAILRKNMLKKYIYNKIVLLIRHAESKQTRATHFPFFLSTIVLRVPLFLNIFRDNLIDSFDLYSLIRICSLSLFLQYSFQNLPGSIADSISSRLKFHSYLR